MNAYVDTLTEWYEQAERITKTNLPNDGDSVILPLAYGYEIEAATSGWTTGIVRATGETARILQRAPKHKPAWHGAVAVLASVDGGPQRLMWEVDDGWWSDGLIGCAASEMESVTPLIEAKVTDEMVQRFVDADTDGSEDISYLLAVALGIDPE